MPDDYKYTATNDAGLTVGSNDGQSWFPIASAQTSAPAASPKRSILDSIKKSLGDQANNDALTAQANSDMAGKYLRASFGEIGGGAKDIASGNLPGGLHRIVSGAGVAALPAVANVLPMALAAAPAATIGGIAGGTAGQIGGEQVASALGVGKDWSDIAGDAAAVFAGAAGAKAGSAVDALASQLKYVSAKSVKLPWWLGGGTIQRDTPRATQEALAEFMAKNYKPQTPTEEQIASFMAKGYKPALGNSGIDALSASRMPVPLRPLVASPAEWSAFDQQMSVLQKEASTAGTYHAARGAVGRATDLQQRMGKTFRK